MLEIVIHRDDHIETRGADPAQQRIVLAKIPHEIDATDVRIIRGQLGYDRPALIRAAVIHQHDLEFERYRLKNNLQTGNQLLYDRSAAIDRDDDGNAGLIPGNAFSRRIRQIIHRYRFLNFNSVVTTGLQRSLRSVRPQHKLDRRYRTTAAGAPTFQKRDR